MSGPPRPPLTSFAQFALPTIHPMPFYEAITRERLITFQRSPSGIQYLAQAPIGSVWAATVADLATRAPREVIQDFYVLSHLFTEGPKVFSPTDLQAECLARTLPRVSLEHYRQPFPTLVVELPRAYRESRLVADGQPAVLVILRHEPDWDHLLVQIVHGDWSVSAYTHTTDDPTIEDALQRMDGIPWSNSSNLPGVLTVPLTDSLKSVMASACRVAVNAAMLLVSLGMLKKGHTNPGHAQRLGRYLARAEKEGETDRAADLRRQIGALPERVEFEQHVTLHTTQRRSRPEREDGEPTGRIVTPHWRCGHIRAQRHGAGRTLTRPVFIRPCLVNGHLLTGPLSRTAAYYTLGDESHG